MEGICPEPSGIAQACSRLLLAEDSAPQRILVATLLRRLGYDVVEAPDGAEALALFLAEPFPYVVSDWMMPGLSGPELCREIRAQETDTHSYVMLLTSRQEVSDISEGLGAGADDFLSKPVESAELAARLGVGARIIELQRRLHAQRREVADAYDRLKRLHDELDRDLAVAAALQRSFLPAPLARRGALSIASLWRPAGHVGGDHIGHFDAGDGVVGLYAIDVAGHGVASALLAVQLAQHFAPREGAPGIAYRREPGGRSLREPHEVAARLNARFQSEGPHDLYFTMLYGLIDGRTGELRYCQAGHPSPCVIADDGDVAFPGEGGAPVGLLPDVDYRTQRLQLAPGDRLLLHSDGLSEAVVGTGMQLGSDGLAAILSRHGRAPLDAALSRIEAEAAQALCPGTFDDDVSALLVEWTPGPDRSRRAAATG